MRYGCIARAIALGVALASAPTAGATTVKKLSFEALAADADTIIQGRVEELNNREAPDRSSVTTLIKVSVIEQFKGAKVTSVTIEQPGGSIGGVTQASPGLAQFSPGENVIVFLERRRKDAYRLVAGKQGKFTAKAQAGNEQIVVQDFAYRTEPLGSFITRLKQATKRDNQFDR